MGKGDWLRRCLSPSLNLFPLSMRERVAAGRVRGKTQGRHRLSLFGSGSPVPAGSRVAFFTGLKKVTKESAFRRCARHVGCQSFRLLMACG